MYKHTWYVAPDGANHYLVALGYKHAAPPEQGKVSQVDPKPARKSSTGARNIKKAQH